MILLFRIILQEKNHEGDYINSAVGRRWLRLVKNRLKQGTAGKTYVYIKIIEFLLNKTFI